MIDAAAVIHPLAFVSDAIVGARTRIWQFASVIRGTRLGEDCNVASSATLDGPWFGDRCIISQGVAMGPGFKFGDDIFVGPNVTVCNDRWPRSAKAGFDVSVFDGKQWTVIVGDGASIGANGVILPGVRIGAGAMIAAGSVVDRDVADCHIFKRDGSMVPIDPARSPKRMRLVA